MLEGLLYKETVWTHTNPIQSNVHHFAWLNSTLRYLGAVIFERCRLHSQKQRTYVYFVLSHFTYLANWVTNASRRPTEWCACSCVWGTDIASPDMWLSAFLYCCIYLIEVPRVLKFRPPGLEMSVTHLFDWNLPCGGGTLLKAHQHDENDLAQVHLKQSPLPTCRNDNVWYCNDCHATDSTVGACRQQRYRRLDFVGEDEEPPSHGCISQCCHPRCGRDSRWQGYVVVWY